MLVRSLLLLAGSSSRPGPAEPPAPGPPRYEMLGGGGQPKAGALGRERDRSRNQQRLRCSRLPLRGIAGVPAGAQGAGAGAKHNQPDAAGGGEGLGHG